jgi:hypothetical protein
MQTTLGSVDAWLKLAPTLLGVDGPIRLLVELQDGGELRSTGGFIGSYGILTVVSGRILPFTLNDIYALDQPYEQRAGWPSAPAKYSWWPFPGYGLRDSNLSFDFPTSAQYGMKLLKTEGGPNVQGVVALTLPVIQRTLTIIGSVPLPEYGVTVTAENLESLLRYYTETNADRAGSDLPSSEQLTTIHERFTALIGQALMAKLQKAKSQQLLAITQMLFSSIGTRDLQLYLTNPQAEEQLRTEDLASGIVRGPQDGVTVVDSNIGGNKANLFTKVNYADAITIDKSGTTIHRLTITYHFNSASDESMIHYLYGRMYYLTYLRIYVAPNAKLLSDNGLSGSHIEINVSDEPGRQMWGGYVNVQDGVPYVLHLTWSVANAATLDSNGVWHYQLIFQHQAESHQGLTLSITLPGSNKPALSFRGSLLRDTLFVLPSDSAIT